MARYRPEFQTVGVLATRRLWMQHYSQFMALKGKSISKIPVMGYKELDLYRLYQEVISYGGFQEVVDNVGTWSKIWKSLPNYDPSITDSSYRLKKNYEKFLYDYENNFFDYEKRQPRGDLNLPKLEDVKVPPPVVTNAQYSSKAKTRKPTRRPRARSRTSPTPPPVNPPAQTENLPPTQGKTEEDEVKSEEEELKIPDMPSMPMKLTDSLILLDPGLVIPRPPYFDTRFIYPVGFKTSRLYPSMKDPSKKVQYICEITDMGHQPVFTIAPKDAPEEVVVNRLTPGECWQVVRERIQAAGGTPDATPGTALFGLEHPEVQKLLQRMLQYTQDTLVRLPKKRRYNKRQRKNNGKFYAEGYTSVKRMRLDIEKHHKATDGFVDPLEADANVIGKDALGPTAPILPNLPSPPPPHNPVFITPPPGGAPVYQNYGVPTMPKDNNPYYFDFLFLYNLFSQKGYTNPSV
mmetsp:Transcript_21261/g.23762  ORF Transcript_21261/g.23762 Transcript_21261/m.23762 type:complete len:462 (+) Transcript_21261:167-1552(+)|eukprot:CAMPEP_0168531560 /NCGR_PEP_ID=MMETSP0405-20121227/15564_1 /TAXON_ID=498012 /ORGANISM="Trichosphaerium sp, Strain Am-I-7 wt" /LENGTH=461 /DNA_ID=CAMNT_0008556473 /DNA_START=127 /DNA_END=1512 /DNA_ORIENTATION=-